MSAKNVPEKSPAAAPAEDKSFSLSRRRFLQGLGGGIFVLFSWGTLRGQEGRHKEPALPGDFNAYLRIAPDGRVSCLTGKIEMGQGVVTSLAMILAEELDVPLGSVDTIMGDTDLCPYDRGTFGSRSIRFFGPPLREAAAEARAVLIQLASDRLSVPKERLVAKGGVVEDKSDKGKSITYGQLAEGKLIERRVTPKPTPKPAMQYTIVGKAEPRQDGMAKVTGKALYSGDLRVPGMLYGRVLLPPAHGAKLKGLDASALKADKETRFVHEGDLVAVLHPSPDGAQEAISRVKAVWEMPKNDLDAKTIYAHLLKVAPAGETVTEGGSLVEGQKLAATTYEAVFYDHYMAHACIETHTALAKPEGERMVVWASTQNPFGAKDEIAEALSVSLEKVRVITPFVGGGFGGKTFNLQAVAAARLAKLAGKPVQVAWTRREEFFYDTFRPAGIAKVRSGTDPSGRIVLWAYDVYFSGPRGAGALYAVPDHRELSHGHYTGVPGAHPFPTGAWRAPGANFNVFARESHIDTMASRLGLDPVEFRLRNSKDPRLSRVLSLVREKFGWKKAPSPSGRGVGVACAEDAGTYIASMAEIDVDRASGRVRVKRIVCVQDMGIVVNPDGAKTELEGGLVMGLGQALTEEVRFKGGEVLDKNFDTYEIPRFSWLPKIEIFLVESREVQPQGGGEPPIVTVAAVIANALFDAAGARLHDLPMTPERVKDALQVAEKVRS